MKNKGFTIIELMVAVVIVGMFVSAVICSNNKREEFKEREEYSRIYYCADKHEDDYRLEELCLKSTYNNLLNK